MKTRVPYTCLRVRASTGVHRVRSRHAGYTLLELLLATLIAAMLMGALYVAMQVTLNQMDLSREQVQSDGLARGVFSRMAADLSSPLGPLQPKSGGGTSSSTSTDTTESTGTSTTSSTTSSTSTSGASTASATTSGATTSTDTTTGIANDTASAESELAADVPLQAGVIGTDTQLTLYLARTPPALTDPEAAANPDVLQPSDQRRVTYYLGEFGGLCRQERPWVTADGVRASADPDYSTESVDVIAREVVDAYFEYYDAGTWLTEWDGSQTASDGKSATGPPRAVRVTLTFEYVGRGGVPVQKVVSHVFSVRAAVGAYLPPIDESTTEDSGTTGTTTSTTSTGGM